MTHTPVVLQCKCRAPASYPYQTHCQNQVFRRTHYRAHFVALCRRLSLPLCPPHVCTTSPGSACTTSPMLLCTPSRTLFLTLSTLFSPNHHVRTHTLDVSSNWHTLRKHILLNTRAGLTTALPRLFSATHNMMLFQFQSEKESVPYPFGQLPLL
jgi:hypothetical protein